MFLSLALLAGCNMVWRKILPNPDKNQVVRVEKGERIYFDLEVRIRIHRGYDGPSAVRFFYKSPGKPIKKEFTITLYRRIGDYAFWE